MKKKMAPKWIPLPKHWSVGESTPSPCKTYNCIVQYPLIFMTVVYEISQAGTTETELVVQEFEILQIPTITSSNGLTKKQRDKNKRAEK